MRGLEIVVEVVILVGKYVYCSCVGTSLSLADSKVEASAALTPGPQLSSVLCSCWRIQVWNRDTVDYVTCADIMMTPDAIQGDTIFIVYLHLR